jgi:hypothetical protein
MTIGELGRHLMRACAGSKLPLDEQLKALGTAYVSYGLAHGIKPEDLKLFLDKVVEEIERAQRAAPMN